MWAKKNAIIPGSVSCQLGVKVEKNRDPLGNKAIFLIKQNNKDKEDEVRTNEEQAFTTGRF